MSGNGGAALVKRVEALEQTVSQLCSRTARHLAEVKTRQSSVALTALAAELYFLGDACRRLGGVIAAKEGPEVDGSIPSDFPLLAECSCLLRALDAHLDQLSPEAALELQAAALDYRKHILRISSCESAAGIRELLSEFQGGSCFGLSESLISQVRPTLPPAHSEANSPDVSSASGKASANITESQILHWIDLLLSPELDREPEEFYQERLSLHTFRSRHPQFPVAAAQWPRHAEAFWPTLKPFLSSYFKKPGPYNWVHWVLEYARETWPETFDPSAPSQDAILDMTENLCQGDLLPIHFAAALGLPSLCAELIAMAKEENQSIDPFTGYGTPLYCALLGPRALMLASHVISWDDIFYTPEDPENRAKTVLYLLEAGCDCEHLVHYWSSDERASFLGLALWVSLVTGDEKVLSQIVAKKAPLDDNLIPLLTNTTFLDRGCKEGRLFVSLLAIIFDQLLLRVLKGTTLGDTGLLETIDGIMTDCDLKFSMLGKVRRVNNVTDTMFSELVHDVLFLEDTPHVLQRLALDPRFDANQPWVEDSEASGTILHMAVSGDLLGVVEVLVERGADLTALDQEGRTPLLLAESTEVLDKLVHVYGDTTTSTDDFGRNIWHYAAASNDIGLLMWLLQNDPSKDENLTATTVRGCTPAAEAFFYINELAAMPKETKPQSANTARLILKECKDDTYLQSHKPLAHVAAAWGDEGLVEDLVALGVDFRQIDENGQSALHYLNSFAPPKLVRRLQELCEGLPIANDYGQTPAETMLSNITLYELEGGGFTSLSAHPSCYKLYAEGFAQALTPQVLSSMDFRGRDLWTRVCALLTTHNYQPGEMWFLRDMITSAIRILASRGVIKRHEEMTGRSALYALALPQEKGLPRWNPCQRHAVIQLTLTLSDESLTKKLYQSDDGIQLLIDAIDGRCAESMHFLSRSVPLHKPSTCLKGRTVLDYVIGKAMDVADVIFVHASETELRTYRTRILDVAKNLPADERADVLHLLRVYGMDVNADEVNSDDKGEAS